MPPPLDLLPDLLRGLVWTLALTASGCALAVVMALAAGLCRLSSFRSIRYPAVVYIEVFRGTSALVQLFWFYFVLPFFGLNMSAFAAGVLVLGLNAGAYGAEVVRGAVQAVPEGQREAAIALNFTPGRTLWTIILPQALVGMVPPFGNIFIELLKNTALVSLITISELTFTGQTLRAETFRTKEIFSLTLLLYFAVALCITFAMRRLELRLRRGIDTGLAT